MTKDIVEYVKKCLRCQKNASFHVAPVEELSSIMSPWPFNKWGIDLLGPFPLTVGQMKYLIMAIDYFKKWVEEKSLSTIMVSQTLKFVWRNIFTRFGITNPVVINNGTQFINQKFRGFLASYKVKHHFTSVEHP